VSESGKPAVSPQAEAATARTRRSFLRAALAAGAAALGGELWIALRRAEEPAAPQFPVTGAAVLRPGDAIAFSAPRTAISGLLVRLESGEFVAIDRRCPHLGCPVQWSREAAQFECPCHAAAFEGETGKVVKGPPRTGLRRFAVEMRDGEVWVIGAAARPEA
jgi:nitrite reductase/ring-hydroxylating ferredoxin subunit